MLEYQLLQCKTLQGSFLPVVNDKVGKVCVKGTLITSSTVSLVEVWES